MKRRNRSFVLFLAVLLLLPLFGCAEQPYETVGAITDWEDDSSWVLPRIKGGVLSDEGYYYTNDSMLYFADTANGIEVCLCSKPGCLHEKGTPQEQEWCDAFIFGSALMPMFFWDDHLFYIERDLYGTHVYRRNADGTALTVVADLGTQYTKERKSVLVGYYAHVGDYLYYDATVESTVLTENEETTLTEMSYIGRLDLKTNKEEILVESEFTLLLGAACPDGLLFMYGDNSKVNYEDENYREQLYESPSYVKFLDSKTGEVTVVLSRKWRDLSGIRAAWGSKLYYSRLGGTWEYDMKTGEDRSISSGTPIDGQFGLQQVDGKSVLYYIPTGELLPTTFAGERLSVDTVSHDAVVLKRTIFKDGVSTSATYCYVKLEDLADGLQEKDALDLYTYKYRKTPTSYEEMVEQWEEMYG